MPGKTYEYRMGDFQTVPNSAYKAKRADKKSPEYKANQAILDSLLSGHGWMRGVNPKTGAPDFLVTLSYYIVDGIHPGMHYRPKEVSLPTPKSAYYSKYVIFMIRPNFPVRIKRPNVYYAAGSAIDENNDFFAIPMVLQAMFRDFPGETEVSHRCYSTPVVSRAAVEDSL